MTPAVKATFAKSNYSKRETARRLILTAGKIDTKGNDGTLERAVAKMLREIAAEIQP